MPKFPKQPFTLKEGKEGDQDLLDYLKNSNNFKYLEKDSRKIITGLKSKLGDDGLQAHQKKLLKLWHSVLTDALLNLKTKDRREYDNKHPNLKTFFHPESLGITELIDILKGFSEFEGMLYGASPKRYRDHIVHSFRVWIIGQGILREGLRRSVSTYETEALKISTLEWECMWAIVALCHDIGYPLSAVERINALARETFKKQGLVPGGDLRFVFRQQMLPFHNTVIQMMASKPVAEGRRGKFLTHLQNKYYLKLLKSFDRLDHGVISSLLLSKALVYFLESDLSHDPWKPLKVEDCRQFLIRREILRAIAAHTCQDIYHLNFDTLSFLLYIADEIQCWGRPTLEELQNRARDFGRASVTVNEFSKQRIDIEISIDDPCWDEDHQESVSLQVGKLHRMLRLAVDTPEIVRRKLSLHFKIQNRGGQLCFLELTKGKIHKEDNFND